MKRNLNQKIRDHLETLSEPVRAVDVAIALDAPRNIVNNALSSMAKVGLVTYARGVGYTKGVRKPLTAKEASMRGGLATKAKAKPKPVKPKPISITPRKLGITEAAAVRDTFPCTDAWLAQNPEKLVRLPPGVWSNPVLRFDY